MILKYPLALQVLRVLENLPPPKNLKYQKFHLYPKDQRNLKYQMFQQVLEVLKDQVLLKNQKYH